jgi:hypothetical protein
MPFMARSIISIIILLYKILHFNYITKYNKLQELIATVDFGGIIW